MSEAKTKSKVLLFRLLLMLPLLLLIIGIIYMVIPNETIIYGEFSFVENLPSIRKAEDSATDGLTIIPTGNRWAEGREIGRGGYLFHVTTEKIDDHRFSFTDHWTWIEDNRQLSINDDEDRIYLIFENFIPNLHTGTDQQPRERETFLLKLFYEFEEIEFRVENQLSFNTEFLFNLPVGHQIQIPIQLPSTINSEGNLTIGMFASPEYNTVNPLAEWYYYCPLCLPEMLYSMSSDPAGIVTNFPLLIGDDINNSIREDEQILNQTNIFITVTPEFYPEDIGIDNPNLSGPPSPWTVSAGEEVELMFAIYHADSLEDPSQRVIDHISIVALLNWEQIDINGQPYFSKSSEIAAEQGLDGIFTIIAPEVPGYYDLVAFLIVETNDLSNFHRGTPAWRFTLKVE